MAGDKSISILDPRPKTKDYLETGIYGCIFLIEIILLFITLLQSQTERSGRNHNSCSIEACDDSGRDACPIGNNEAKTSVTIKTLNDGVNSSKPGRRVQTAALENYSTLDARRSVQNFAHTFPFEARSVVSPPFATVSADRPRYITTGKRPACVPNAAGRLENNQLWMEKLLDKIQYTESSTRINTGNLDTDLHRLTLSKIKDGDGGLAVGPLQLHPCVVDDVNRYYGMDFTYEDRRDLFKSRQMARLYISMWMYRYREEMAARIFNGGPRGWNTDKTNGYWKKILDTD